MKVKGKWFLLNGVLGRTSAGQDSSNGHTTIPLEGATVRVYKEGKVVQQLTSNEKGIVEFPTSALGVYAYQAEYPELQQYNDPATVIFAQQQPGGLTGLFTAISGNWILLLLAALWGYAGYRNYSKK